VRQPRKVGLLCAPPPAPLLAPQGSAQGHDIVEHSPTPPCHNCGPCGRCWGLGPSALSLRTCGKAVRAPHRGHGEPPRCHRNLHRGRGILAAVTSVLCGAPHKPWPPDARSKEPCSPPSQAACTFSPAGCLSGRGARQAAGPPGSLIGPAPEHSNAPWAHRVGGGLRLCLSELSGGPASPRTQRQGGWRPSPLPLCLAGSCSPMGSHLRELVALERDMEESRGWRDGGALVSDGGALA